MLKDDNEQIIDSKIRRKILEILYNRDIYMQATLKDNPCLQEPLILSFILQFSSNNLGWKGEKTVEWEQHNKWLTGRDIDKSASQMPVNIKRCLIIFRIMVSSSVQEQGKTVLYMKGWCANPQCLGKVTKLYF